MGWATIIERNLDRLLAVIAELFALTGGAMADSLPRHVYRALLIMLRPVESAVRRLIIIAARGLALKLRPGRAFPAGLALKSSAERLPAFRLIDPLKRCAPQGFEWGKVQVIPRISVPGLFDPAFLPPRPIPSEDEAIAAGELCRRLQALKHALETLPKQARRLARWRAKGELARHAASKPGRLSPFRPGFAPGYHRHEPNEIDQILGDCHYFAVEAWKRQDTS